MIQLSIIVPVYNVEPYIRPCFESIFNQGLNENNYEVIIVNDGSTDKSMEMIADMICQHDNITIINQENLSLSVARNNGIAVAKGEYILMLDSDDLLIKNSLKPLLEKALESQTDLIVADYLVLTDEGINDLQDITQKDFSIIEITGEQLFLNYLDPYHCFVWRALYRRQFLNSKKLKFYPGIRFQDVPFTHECYLKAHNALRISCLLTIYRQWYGSSTGSFNLIKAKDFCTAIALTWKLNIMDLNPAIAYKLQEDVWISFSMMLKQIYYEIRKPSERLQIIDFFIKEMPELNFHHGKKQKLVSLLLRNVPHTFIRLYFIYKHIHEYRLFLKNKIKR